MASPSRSERPLEQGALFDADVLGRPLPMVGEQKDIRYFGIDRAQWS